MKFGEIVKSQRLRFGMSQHLLAEKSELTQSAISQYESGIREPKWSDFLTICKALSINPNDFIQ